MKSSHMAESDKDSSKRSCLESHLTQLLANREYPKTICPSEGPRGLSKAELEQMGANEWRDLMDEARAILWRMRDRGEVEILQRGQVLGDDVGVHHVKGPLRVRMKKSAPIED